MTKTELANALAERIGITKAKASEAVTAVFGAIEDELAGGGRVTINGFGTFAVKERAERRGVHPKTGEPTIFQATKKVRFKAGTPLADSLAAK